MNVRRPVLTFVLIAATYSAVLVWTDSRNQVSDICPTLLSVLPTLMCLASLSIIIRYVRWHWLLSRSNHKLPAITGFCAYVSGFAFTATPGKVGELIRIRYHTPLRVPPVRVTAAFIYERASDLICVAVLACLSLNDTPLFVAGLCFVVALLVLIGIFSVHPGCVTTIGDSLPQCIRKIFDPLINTMRGGLTEWRVWLTYRDIAVSAVLGLMAWGLLAVGFIWLLRQLGIELPLTLALSVYPVALLAGAASMIPGGLGSTEAAIIVVLTGAGTDVNVASVAAVTIRIATLWLAMVLGTTALFFLEGTHLREWKD